MARPTKKTTEIVITAPNYKVLETIIVGDAQIVSNNFSRKAEDEMKHAQEEGAKSKTRKKDGPKDFEEGYKGSMHISEEGWSGLPATAFRAALIRACSTCGVEMTKAKMCIFVLADGYEAGRGTPLVKIIKGKPEQFTAYVRNANGSADIRSRARWNRGWEVKLRVRYDADVFTAEMIANLIMRAGISVGVGAGRPFSSMSAGQGWGTWEIKDAVKREAAEKAA